VGSNGAAAVVVFSAISASVSWSEGIMMGMLVGRGDVSAPAAVIIGAGVKVEFGLAGEAVGGCCVRILSRRSGS
jgi:hypothetical protein